MAYDAQETKAKHLFIWDYHRVRVVYLCSLKSAEFPHTHTHTHTNEWHRVQVTSSCYVNPTQAQATGQVTQEEWVTKCHLTFLQRNEGEIENATRDNVKRISISVMSRGDFSGRI